jgi:hypothetical protein
MTKVTAKPVRRSFVIDGVIRDLPIKNYDWHAA